MIKVIGPKDKNFYKNKLVINTTSTSKNWSKELSPFYLKTNKLFFKEGFCLVENAWQFSKVYKCHTDKYNEPTKEYFKWREKGINDIVAHRYPMGKNAIPEYTLFNGEKFNYIEARKKLYIPLYETAVKHTEAFNNLYDMVIKKQDILLFDFDGYSDYNNIEEVINNPKRKMGHAFVLAKILEKT